jgi:hypothetical protein
MSGRDPVGYGYGHGPQHRDRVRGTYTVYVGNSSGLVGNPAGCTAFEYTGAIEVGGATRNRLP